MQRPAASLASLEGSGSGSLGVVFPPLPWPPLRVFPRAVLLHVACLLRWRLQNLLPDSPGQQKCCHHLCCYRGGPRACLPVSPVSFGSLRSALASSTRTTENAAGRCRRRDWFSPHLYGMSPTSPPSTPMLPAAESWHLEKPLSFLEIRQLV
jgi:hypothetical protein